MPAPGVVLREAASSRDQQTLPFWHGCRSIIVPWQLPCYLKVPRGRATAIGTPAFVWPNLSPKLKEVLYQSLPLDDGGFLMPLWLHLGESLKHTSVICLSITQPYRTWLSNYAFDRVSSLIASQQRISIRATSTSPFTSITAVHIWKTKSCVPLPEEIARQDLELICIAGAPRQLLLDWYVMVIGRFEAAKVDRFAQRFPQTAANSESAFPIVCSDWQSCLPWPRVPNP